MQKLLVQVISILWITLFALGGLSINASARPLPAESPLLGASASYSVLGASTVTNTGLSLVSGDVGVSPGTAITGFPPGIVGPPGAIHANDTSATAAQADNSIVYNALDQACDQTFGAVDLSLIFPDGVPPGTYCSTSSFSLSGNLNLIGSGVWIFKTGSTLLTSPDSSITGGDPCNVWWRVGSSATLDTNTSFIGSIYALTSITMNTGASLDGRALAQTGAVTLDSNVIIGPICAAQPTSVPTTAVPTSTPTTAVPTSVPTTAVSTSVPATALSTGVQTATRVIDTPTGTLEVLGLPTSGGAPIKGDDFPWILAIVCCFSVIALSFGIGAYRSANRTKH